LNHLFECSRNHCHIQATRHDDVSSGYTLGGAILTWEYCVAKCIQYEV